jgi:CxxC-x17-CxxC domain-containing protein
MNTKPENIRLKCADCGCDFEFTPEEQEFYAEKGFSEPKRCSGCRSRNRERKKDRMGFSARQSVRYDVICSACGAETSVPFKPTQDRPLYCPDCYKKFKEEV